MSKVNEKKKINLLFRILQKFSIEVVSGVFAGQSRTGILFSLNYSFVDFSLGWSKAILEDEFIVPKLVLIG